MTGIEPTRPRRKWLKYLSLALVLVVGGGTFIAYQVVRYLDEPRRQPAYGQMLTLAMDLHSFDASHGRSPNDAREFLEFASEIREWPENRRRPALMAMIDAGKVEIVWGAILSNLPKNSPAWKDVVASISDPGRDDRTWVLYRDSKIERLSNSVAVAMPRAKSEPEASKKRNDLWLAVHDVRSLIHKYEAEHPQGPSGIDSLLLSVDEDENHPRELKRTREIVDHLRSGRIKVNWGTRIWNGDRKAPEAKRILVYAIHPEFEDSVFVATAGGEYPVLSRTEFDASPTAAIVDE